MSDPKSVTMSSKQILTILAFNAVANAILINLHLLHIIHLNWWYIFSPAILSIAIIFSRLFLRKRKQKKPLHSENWFLSNFLGLQIFASSFPLFTRYLRKFFQPGRMFLVYHPPYVLLFLIRFWILDGKIFVIIRLPHKISCPNFSYKIHLYFS